MSSHKTTGRKRAGTAVLPTDPESLVRFAELLKLRSLAASTQAEFLRRYLQHVPPPGQHRVRYFGWMHPAAKARRMLVETLLAVPIVVRPKLEQPPPWHLRCPHCEAFTLVRIGRLPRGPPLCQR